MISHIIFDNNGVLTTSDKELTYRKVSDFLKIPVETVPQLFKKHVKDLDTGKIKQREFYSLALKEGNFNVSLREFAKIHLSGYVPKKDVQEFAKSLKSNYQLSLLSNFGDAFWELYEKWGLSEIFEKQNVFLSSDLALAKPDKRIFLKVLKKLKALPKNCVFIDDAPENVQNAAELNINSILFTSLESLKTSLNKLGIK